MSLIPVIKGQNLRIILRDGLDGHYILERFRKFYDSDTRQTRWLLDWHLQVERECLEIHIGEPQKVERNHYAPDKNR